MAEGSGKEENVEMQNNGIRRITIEYMCRPMCESLKCTQEMNLDQYKQMSESITPTVTVLPGDMVS